MQFGAIIIGDEIMSGKRQDKHMAQVIATLGERGLELAWCQYLADDPALITATLKRTLATDDVVFSFGGIGATPDDHTRQCAADAAGVELAAASRRRSRNPRAFRRRHHAAAPRDGRISARQPHHSQPVQPHPGVQSAASSFPAGISADGVADDGMGAR